MADKKLSALTALTFTATGDEVYIRDISEALPVDQSKKITVADLMKTLHATMLASATNGPIIANEPASDTNPTICPRSLTTGWGGSAGNVLTGIVSSLNAISYQASGSSVLQQHQTTVVSASTTQTQGQGQILGSYINVSTVSNDDDVVTLPAAAAGRLVTIVNSGDNRLQVFPGTGDDLGHGVNVSDKITSGQSRTYLGVDLVGWRPLNVVGQMAKWTANDAIFTGANPAGAIGRNGHAVLTFDDTTDESIIFEEVADEEFRGGDLEAAVHWVSASATTGDVAWAGSLEANAPGGTDIDADSFDSEQETISTTAGTSGIVTKTIIQFSQSAVDGIQPGESFRFRLFRRNGSPDPNMVGDAQVLRVSLTQKGT